MGRRNSLSKEEIDRKQELSKKYAYSEPARGASSGSFTRNPGRYGGTKETIYQRSGHLSAPAPAPTPAPAPPKPKPKPEPKKEQPKVDPSNYVQARRPSASRSGANFNKESTLSERKELTDSFKQKPSYDPDAGVSSPEAGDFLNNYKIDVKKKINTLRSSI